MGLWNMCTGKSRHRPHHRTDETYSHQQPSYSRHEPFYREHQSSTYYRKNDDLQMRDVQSWSSVNTNSEYRQVKTAAPEIPTDHLKMIINIRDKEIAKLNTEIDNLRWDYETRYENYQRQNDDLMSRLKELKRDNSDINRANNKLTWNIIHLGQKVHFFEKELKAAQNKSRKLLEELHAEQSKNNQYRQDGLLTGGNNPFPRLQEHTNDTIAKDAQVVKLKQEKQNLEETIADLQRQNDKLKHDITQLMTRFESVQQVKVNYDELQFELHLKEIELKKVEEEFEETKTRWRESQTELKILLGEKTNNKTRVAELLEEINIFKTENSNLRKEIDQLTQDNTMHSKMHEQYQRSKSEKHDLQIKLRQAESTLQKNSLELDAMKTRIQKQTDNSKALLDSKVARLEEEKRDLELCVANLERESKEMKSEITQLTTRLKSTQKEVDCYDDMQSKLHRTEMKLKETEHNYDALQSKLDNTVMELKGAERVLDDTKTRLQKFSDEEVVKDNEIAKLQIRLAKLEDELQQKNQEANKYKQEISGIQQTKQDKEKHVDTLYKERDGLQQKLYEQDNKERELRDTITKHQQQMDNSQAEHKTEIEKLLQQRHDLESHISNIEQENGRMKGNIQRLTKELERGQKERPSSDDYKALQNRLHRVEKELKEAEFELEDTKTRLSKCMGDKLTNKNPNIVDLSDMNRPSKLADRYKELYDNQWTDAYEVLEKSEGEEERIIQILLDVFIETKRYCEYKTRAQMEATLTAITHSDKVGMSDVPVTVLKYIKDCTKSSSAVDVKRNFEEYKLYLRDGSFVFAKQALYIPDYLKECFEICWLMSIQDPPVVMAPLLKHGATFQSSLYSAYTVSGNLIDFIVWPALLLHENGPTLTKGVAQGMRRK